MALCKVYYKHCVKCEHKNCIRIAKNIELNFEPCGAINKRNLSHHAGLSIEKLVLNWQ